MNPIKKNINFLASLLKVLSIHFMHAKHINKKIGYIISLKLILYHEIHEI
jgi:hypothetical protein